MLISWTHWSCQGADPTAGYVNYVNQTTATNNGYINSNNDLVYIGVDSTNVVNGTGRDSVRITSNAVYNYGLFALDVAHMPGGICGTWQVLPSNTHALVTRASADIYLLTGQHSGCLVPTGPTTAKLTLSKA